MIPCSPRRAAVSRGFLAATTLLIASGCHTHPRRHDHHAVVPHGAVPIPAGTYRDQWQAEQTARADEDFFVFYLYEWHGDSDRLSPFGQRHLERLVHHSRGALYPLLVQPSGDAERDQARVAALQRALAEYDPSWADYPIRIGHPEAEPMHGFESPRVLRGYTGAATGGTGAARGFGGAAGGIGGGGFGGARGGF